MRTPTTNAVSLAAVLFVGLMAAASAATTVIVGQIEAAVAPGQYAPEDFNGSSTVSAGGVTYHAYPGAPTASSTYSSHASGVRNAYLSTPGATYIKDVFNDDADHFLDASVHAGGSYGTLAPVLLGNSIKVTNHSYVGSYGTAADDQDALRRIDYMISKEDTIWVGGAVTNYDPTGLPITWAMRNGISVRGAQAFRPTVDGWQIGKRHGDICAPLLFNGTENSASFTTPIITGYAAGLVGQARDRSWAQGETHEVIKSVLMTGASRSGTFYSGTGAATTWTNGTGNNLDIANGAGRADYNASLAILANGEQSVASVSGGIFSTSVLNAGKGWVYDSLNSGDEQAVLFEVTSTMAGLSATLVWDVTQAEPSPGLIDTTDSGVLFPNLNLELFPVTSLGGSNYSLGASLGIATLASLVTNDNLQHIFYDGSLSAGYYAFLLSNAGSLASDYGFSYVVIPEPGSLVFAGAVVGLFLWRSRR